MTYKFIEIGKNDDVARLKIQKGEDKLSFKEVFTLWQKDPTFTAFYVNDLLPILGNSFFWEHPPLMEKHLDKEYELVIRKTRSYDCKMPNEVAFEEHFCNGEKVATFYNLGKNARLIVPAKIGESEHYKHLGAFMEQADQEQIIELFDKVGAHVLNELKTGQQIWLNTAGLGVIWLHIRLDTRPKYYKTKRYKDRHFFA
ncbi:hypothetical protein [Flammeovirga sp. SJP92]|uniref:DUF6940 family protein n=1 Tax=Flammeovirga sp. SJP92 TaxID=1775430 RepID=UPI000787FCDA|nr:hypothetical protein [Flammeovirga sp. SJP92]KXX71830.1 hypothetical protein AVL50_03330 [Flammeovirga sp. SJP92]